MSDPQNLNREPTDAPPQTRRWGRYLLLFALLAVLIAIGGIIIERSLSYLADQPGSADNASIIIVAPGASVISVLDTLERTGSILSRPLFRFVAWRTRNKGLIKTGEYRIPPRSSMLDILAIIRSGRSIQHRLTIPEGWTVHQVAKFLKTNTRLSGTIKTLPTEGTLRPETYYFTRGTTRRAILKRMKKAQNQLIAALWPQRAPGLPYANSEQAVILASLIEKETAKPEERKNVAAVFLNRLRQGMRLQSDPTVIYGLTRGKWTLVRSISKSDLKTKTPYNTYLISGLPPAPIANPGRAALEAALAPAQTQDLYFVADGSGGHAFARTLKDHRRNVKKWQKIRQSKIPKINDKNKSFEL